MSLSSQNKADLGISESPVSEGHKGISIGPEGIFPQTVKSRSAEQATLIPLL